MMPQLLASAAAGSAPSESGGLPVLSILVFLPAVGAAILAAIGRDDDPRHVRNIALGVMFAGLVPALALLLGFDPSRVLEPAGLIGPDYNATVLQPQFTEKHNWLGGGIGSKYHLGLDGLSLWLVVLTSFLGPIAVSASWPIEKRAKEYFISLLVLQSAMLGVFVAQDILLFYIFFEFTLIPMYLIIGIWGGPERRYAAFKFFLYTFAGGVLTFAGLLWLSLFYAKVSHQPITFDLQELIARLHPAIDHAGLNEYWRTAQVWLFLAMLAGFAVKVPMFPLHTWLPLAHVEAPTAGSVILAAVLLKMGTFGLLKILLPLMPHAVVVLMPWLMAAAIAGILYGALTALAQRDIKRMIAYSSVSHLGWCLVGMFAMTAVGMGGSLMQMVNHGISTGALFFIIGCIYERWHTRDLESYGGLWKSMPGLAFWLIFFSLSSVGLPGLNGFVGEFLILAGIFPVTGAADELAVVGTYDTIVRVPGALYGSLAAVGIVLGAWYMFVLCRKLLGGAEKFPADHPAPDLNLREHSTLAALGVAALLIGVFPRFFLSRIEPSIDALGKALKSGGVVMQTPTPNVKPTAATKPY